MKTFVLCLFIVFLQVDHSVAAVSCLPLQPGPLSSRNRGNLHTVSTSLVCKTKKDAVAPIKHQSDGAILDLGAFMTEAKNLAQKQHTEVRSLLQPCQGNCNPSVEISVSPKKFNFNPECNAVFAETRRNNLTGSTVLKSGQGCVTVQKIAMEWVKSQLGDESGHFWTGCPSPCSYYSTFVMQDLKNNQCRVELNVICGHPRERNFFQATEWTSSIRSNIVCE